MENEKMGNVKDAPSTSSNAFFFFTRAAYRNKHL